MTPDRIPSASKIASSLPAFARRNGSCSTATVRLKKDSGPMTGKFNRAQRIVANIYGDGDFQHVRPGEIHDVGDTLFTFLMVELSDDEGCRSEEHTSELQSLMRNSYAVSGSQKKNNT